MIHTFKNRHAVTLAQDGSSNYKAERKAATKWRPGLWQDAGVTSTPTVKAVSAAFGGRHVKV